MKDNAAALIASRYSSETTSLSTMANKKSTEANPHALDSAQDDDELFEVMHPPPANFDIFQDTPPNTGTTTRTRKLVHQNHDWHCSAHVWLVDFDKKLILLQKRSPDKDTFPNRFDISSAGHLEAGAKDARETAVKEVMEELGLVAVEPNDLEFLFVCPAEQAPWGGCNAYEHVYLLTVNREECQFAIGSAEVTSVKWMPIDELKTAWENGDEAYVPRVEQYKEAFFAKLNEKCLGDAS